MKRAAHSFVAILFCVIHGTALAQPDDFIGVIAGSKPVTLCLPVRGISAIAPLPKKSKLVPLDELQLTGPRPSHPFVLGNFAADGHWGMVNGAVGVTDGNNAALQLAWASDFELEGVIEQSGLGGSFWLLGWDEGHGYALHNVLLKESGSPWFLTEFRGGKAIEDRTLELEKFDWKGTQPFRLSVQAQAVSLTVGKIQVIDRLPVESYHPGRVVLGVYDTRYGPRTLSIKSLKIRALTPGNTPPISAKVK